MANTEKIPQAISDYIRSHFREDFLFELKEKRMIAGQPYYFVEVAKDDYIHVLKFNEKGMLVADQATQAFPPDVHDEPAFEDIPE